jgi:hypothetical protein
MVGSGVGFLVLLMSECLAGSISVAMDVARLDVLSAALAAFAACAFSFIFCAGESCVV